MVTSSPAELDPALNPQHPLRRMLSQIVRMQELDWDLANPPLPRGCSRKGHVSQLVQMADLQARAARQFATSVTPENYQPCGYVIREELERRCNWIVAQTLRAELEMTRQALLACQEALAKEKRIHGRD